VNSNLIAACVLVLSSASWFTIHVALCWGVWPRLHSTRQRWLLILPPSTWLAAVWGFKYGLRGRAISWLVCALTYLGSLVAWA
jgi:hypothetical protein